MNILVRQFLFYSPNIPFTKISIPIAISIHPPSIDAFQESLVPAFRPIRRPPTQITKVTAAMIRPAVFAMIRSYSAIVKPTDNASMEVATP